MEIIVGIDRLKRSFLNPVVTLGNFDGVHLGHQKIFSRVKEEALRIHGEGLVITFEPHPLKVLAPERFLPLLTPFKKKMMLIETSGIETVLCVEFTIAFSEISPDAFIQDILLEKIKVKKVIIGYNYHFGKNQMGDAQTLLRAGERFHFEVEVVEPLRVGNTIVSSSKIRELIKDGQVEEASKLLGRNYPMTGRVIEGVKRGKTLGFPTANLEIPEGLYPKNGVYAVDVIWNQMSFQGLANIGSNPTFSPHSGRLSLEVYILNFNKEIYGEEVEIHFRRRIRDEIRFDSSSHLIEQILKDIEWAKENVFNKNPSD